MHNNASSPKKSRKNIFQQSSFLMEIENNQEINFFFFNFVKNILTENK